MKICILMLFMGQLVTSPPKILFRLLNDSYFYSIEKLEKKDLDVSLNLISYNGYIDSCKLKIYIKEFEEIDIAQFEQLVNPSFKEHPRTTIIPFYSKCLKQKMDDCQFSIISKSSISAIQYSAKQTTERVKEILLQDYESLYGKLDKFNSYDILLESNWLVKYKDGSMSEIKKISIYDQHDYAHIFLLHFYNDESIFEWHYR